MCGVGWRDGSTIGNTCGSQEGKKSLSRAEKQPSAPFAKKGCETYPVLREKGDNIIGVIHAILGHPSDKRTLRVKAGNAGHEQTRQPAAAPCHTHIDLPPPPPQTDE